MNKKIIILCSALLVVLLNGYGQNKELLLTNKISGKERIIHEGQKLKVRLKTGQVYRGELILKDTTNSTSENNQIIIRTQPDYDVFSFNKINLNEIEVIKKISLPGNIIGGTLTAVGSAITIAGVVILSSQTPLPERTTYNNDQIAGIADQNTGKLLSGAFSIVVGIGVTIAAILTWTWISGKRYYLDNWNFSVRTN